VDEVTQKISNGFLASKHLLDERAVTAAANIVQEAARKQLETVRVVFADQHGILRGKTLTTHALLSIFCTGVRMPSTLLLKGVSHHTVFPVWDESKNTPMRGASDVLLVPHPETFNILPHSPHSAMIHASVAYTDGSLVSFGARNVLSKAVACLAEHGFRAVMGLEVEFNVFGVTDAGLSHEATTMPPQPPQTRAINQGYQFLTETRYSECEDILDSIRGAAQEMGMPVRSVEIEMGPSQFEFTFDPADPLTIADMAVNFRTLAKEICQQKGLLASFMAKPKLPNVCANGWHIHQSILDNDSGDNTFVPNKNGTPSKHASSWMAGLIEHAAASCLLTSPTVNGYKRFAPYQLAPNRIGWGVDNRGAMIRALFDANDDASRLENRVADSSANPYFALASQLLSGIDGLSRELPVPDPLNSPYDAEASLLPRSLLDAIVAFESSSMYRHYLGDEVVDYLVHLKRDEWNRYIMSVSDWEQAEYFSVF